MRLRSPSVQRGSLNNGRHERVHRSGPHERLWLPAAPAALEWSSAGDSRWRTPLAPCWRSPSPGHGVRPAV